MNLFGYYGGDLGYNIHTRELFKAMIDLGYDVRGLPYDRSPINIEDHYRSNFGTPDVNGASVAIDYGDHTMYFHGKKRILCSVWETTKLPDEWVKQMNTMDAVWAVSKWGADVFKHSGVDVPIDVVNEGVDPIFTPMAPKVDGLMYDGFTFLTVGKLEKRKGMDLLLQAFCQEFDQKEKVRLVMQVYNPFLGLTPEMWELYQYKILHDMDVPRDVNVQFMPFVPERKYLPSVYCSCDAFVLPTRGEAWGLPIIEAMACGLPTITTGFSGLTEYANDDVAYLLKKFDLIPAGDNQFIQFDEGSMWANPDIDELAKTMRYVVEHQDEARKKGKGAAVHVSKKYRWKNAAKQAIEAVTKHDA